MIHQHTAGIRRTWWRVPLGLLIGLAGSALVLAMIDGRPAQPIDPPAALLSDCDGAIRELVVHYAAEAGDVAATTYRDFLTQLPDDVTVRVVCRDEAAFQNLIQRVGSTTCRVEPVIVGHAITTWSRDRWLAIQTERGTRTTLLCPRREKGQQIWPERRGDAQVGRDLAREFGRRLAWRQSPLLFDGGDFVADDQCVFVTPDVLLRNQQRTVVNPGELLAQLRHALNRRVVLLRKAPPYHAGMFMMTAGDRTVMVGDPATAQSILSRSEFESAEELLAPSGADFSSASIAQFDAVAEQCREEGYRIVRIPVVPGRDGRTYLTYVNVVIDQRDSQRIVYMPVFAGADALNRAAARVWTDLGYEVRPIDCTGCYRHFGSLRCLVNVLSRQRTTM